MSGPGKSILVIDDDDNLCLILKEKFELLGYKVLTASEGAEGLLKTVKNKPDCVILDVLIPKGENGLTYLRKLRSYRHEDAQEQTRIRKTPVIVLTGTGTKMQPIFEFEGIDGFLEKPFNLKNIQDKIESVLQKQP